MTEIESTRSAILETLMGLNSKNYSPVSRLSGSNVPSASTADSVLESLQNLNKNEFKENYGISLKEFTNLNSYLTFMNTLYENNSQTKFKNTINNILNNGNNSQYTNAKTFVEKLRNSGLSASSASKVYNALNSYSLVSTMETNSNSFVSAKI